MDVGDIPTWLGAGGAIGAAISLWSLEHGRDVRDKRDAERSQAEQVSVFVRDGQVKVINKSLQPITDVYTFLVAKSSDDMVLNADPVELIGPDSEAPAPVFVKDGINGVGFSQGLDGVMKVGMDDAPGWRPAMTFLDAQGRRWWRHPTIGLLPNDRAAVTAAGLIGSVTIHLLSDPSAHRGRPRLRHRLTR